MSLKRLEGRVRDITQEKRGPKCRLAHEQGIGSANPGISHAKSRSVMEPAARVEVRDREPHPQTGLRRGSLLEDDPVGEGSG